MSHNSISSPDSIISQGHLIPLVMTILLNLLKIPINLKAGFQDDFKQRMRQSDVL